MEFDLVLEGRAVTPQGVEAVQIGVEGAIIARVAKQGVKGRKRIDASGCLIFPGFIDAHAHLREPGWEYKEDFRTGTRAAIHGGVTTVLDMPNNPDPTTTLASIERKEGLAKGKAVAEVRFFAGVTEENVNGLPRLAERAVGFKLYLAGTTGGLVFPGARLASAFAGVAPTGRPLSIHCEDQAIIARQKSLLGKTTDFGMLRPRAAEEQSVKDVISTAEGAPSGLRVNVCHLSTAWGLAAVESARRSGMRITCEATLHHLYFTDRGTKGNGFMRTNPPLRPEEDRSALVDGIRSGAVDLLVTDHAPHTMEEKRSEDPPSGVPGLDNYANVVSWLVSERAVSPERIALVSAANPAAIFGFPDRGQIAEGKRADFCVLDMHRAEEVKNDELQTKCGWSPYEGKRFPGKARWTVVGGRVAMDDCAISP